MARCGSTSREKRQDDEGVRIKPGSLADGLGLKEAQWDVRVSCFSVLDHAVSLTGASKALNTSFRSDLVEAPGVPRPLPGIAHRTTEKACQGPPNRPQPGANHRRLNGAYGVNLVLLREPVPEAIRSSSGKPLSSMQTTT